MAKISRRMKRYADLRYTGFTHREALALSWIDKHRYTDASGRRRSESYEWFDTLCNDRAKWYDHLCVKGVGRGKDKRRISRKDFESRVGRSYRAKGWLTVDAQGRMVIDVYQLVRYYADRFHAEHPEWRSPSEFRHYSMLKFQRALDRTLGMY